MADDIKTLKITTVGENKYTYEKESGFPFTIVEGEVYKRVPAQKYEIVFPMSVNENGYTVGGFYAENMGFDDTGLTGGTFVFKDDDLINDVDGLFRLEFYVYLDSISTTLVTDNHVVLQGEYGRYLISETQVADEPVAYTLEPAYDYVLVE